MGSGPFEQFARSRSVQFRGRRLIEPVQQIKKCFGRLAFIDRWRMGLLAEFVSASIDEHGDMKIIRRRQVEAMLQIDLPRRGVEQVASAQHFGDVLLVIIDHDSQLVSKSLVTPSNDKVPRLFCQVMLDAPLQSITNADRIRGRFDSERVRLMPPDCLVTAETRIGGGALWVYFRRSAQRFPGTDARIEQPLFVQ